MKLDHEKKETLQRNRLQIFQAEGKRNMLWRNLLRLPTILKKSQVLLGSKKNLRKKCLRLLMRKSRLSDLAGAASLRLHMSRSLTGLLFGESSCSGLCCASGG